MSKGGQSNEMASMEANLKAGEQERQVEARHFDGEKFASKMKDLQAKVSERREADRAKEQALNAVQVSDDDVKLVAAHCDMEPAAARRKLQDAKGSLPTVLEQYIKF